MLKAPIPVDEVDRLADLRALQLLDTPPEERFDRITQLAAQVLDVPIAYLALIDSDRQWFKSIFLARLKKQHVFLKKNDPNARASHR